MTVEQALRLTNRNMIAFDLLLGSAAIAAPEATLRVLGHDEPSPDAAHLFRLAVESALPGTRLNGVAEEGIPVREIAEVIGRHLELPVVSIPVEEAPGHFGFLGAFFARDIVVSSARTRGVMGWEPVQPGLISDLDEGHYFEPAPAVASATRK